MYLERADRAIRETLLRLAEGSPIRSSTAYAILNRHADRCQDVRTARQYYAIAVRVLMADDAGARTQANALVACPLCGQANRRPNALLSDYCDACMTDEAPF